MLILLLQAALISLSLLFFFIFYDPLNSCLDTTLNIDTSPVFFFVFFLHSSDLWIFASTQPSMLICPVSFLVLFSKFFGPLNFCLDTTLNIDTACIFFFALSLHSLSPWILASTQSSVLVRSVSLSLIFLYNLRAPEFLPRHNLQCWYVFHLFLSFLCWISFISRLSHIVHNHLFPHTLLHLPELYPCSFWWGSRISYSEVCPGMNPFDEIF